MKGYGMFSVSDESKFPRAHRYSFKAHYGWISSAHEVDHICHERLCVNPEHLRQVTSA